MTRKPGTYSRRHRARRVLQFLGEWLEYDHDNPASSLARFVGNPVYGPLHPEECRQERGGLAVRLIA
jgi:hypothetical protein